MISQPEKIVNKIKAKNSNCDTLVQKVQIMLHCKGNIIFGAG